MNCREFLAEFEERQNVLSETAQLHLNDCPGCKKTSGEQTRVWQMIDGLRRVDAPNNFDFRVKAKIADARPADFQSRFFPALRYVLPLGLVVLILGLVVYNTAYFSTNNAAPQIAAEKPLNNSSPSEQSAAPDNPPQSFTDENLIVGTSNRTIKTAEAKPEGQLIIAESARKPPVKSRRENPKNNSDGAGSSVKAQTSPKIFMPENLNPNQPVETSPNGSNSNSVSGEEILQLLGIEVIKENGHLKVKAVQKDSSAERSDVKVGDVIEAVDGVKLSAEPLRRKRIEVKRLTVTRGTAKIEIALKN